MKKILFVLLIASGAIDSTGQTCFPFDNNFGINGESIGFTTTSWLTHTNLVVLPDNKVLQFSSNYANGYITLKYKVNGGLDSSFGLNGRATFNMGNGSQVNAGAVQTDGKILMAGNTYSSNYYRMALVRLNANGTLDAGFGIGGAVIPSIGNQNEEARDVVIQPDGKIIVVGYSSGNCFIDCLGNSFCRKLFTVLRFHVNGTADSSFGQNGKIIFGAGSFNSGIASSVVIQPDGKIVVAGETLQYYCDDYYGGGSYSSGFFMTRLNSNGTTDASFGLNGQVRDTIELMNTWDFALQPDGKFLALGYKNNTGYGARRYNSNGQVDNSFSQNVVFDDWMISMALMPDGKIVMGGQTWVNGFQDFLLARLKSNGSLDSTFNLNGKLIFHLGTPTSSEGRVTGLGIQGNRIIAGGGFSTNTAGFVYTELIVRLKDTVSGLAVNITPSGTLYPCQSSGVTLTSSQQGNYEWFKNSTLVSGAISQSYFVNTTGSYRVRVTNTNGCGISDPVYVGVNGLPVSVGAASSTSICQGDSVKLVANKTGLLQWYFNNIAISNAIDTIYWAKTQGSYYVTVSNTNGCGTSGSIFVQVSPSKPVVNWNGTSLSTVTGFSSYQWYLNGSPIPNATTPVLTPGTTGIYKVAISGYQCTPMSDDFNLNCSAVAVIKPTISWNGTQLSVSNIYNGYQWYFNNNPIPNATSYFIIINQTGTYSVAVIGKLACTNSSADLVLTCNEAGPAKPAINWNGTQFITNTGYANYQWFYNDTAIVGANNYLYAPAPTKFGRYKVEVTNGFNCSRFSDERFYSPTDIVTLGVVKFTYYPNPVRETFYIDVLQASLKTIKAVVYDMNGKKLMDQTLKQGQNQVNVKGLSAGLYHLEILFGSEKKTLKLAIID